MTRKVIRYFRYLAVPVICIAGIWFYDKVLPGILAEDLPRADRVVVHKKARELLLMNKGKVVKIYTISLGGNPEGHKQGEGDQRTPEGNYVLDWRKKNSLFHRSLHISYPDPADKAAAAARGDKPGGFIMIHGRTNWLSWAGFYFSGRDWTDGCIAVTNTEIVEIWQAVPDGTPITILP